MQTAKLDKLERIGLESVPTELKTSNWFDYFIIQLSFSVNSGNFIVPALAVLDGRLPIFWAIASTFSGAALAFLFVSLLSLPGAKYGLPAQYAIRSILGTKVARYLSSPIRSLTSLYWFSVQTISGTIVITEMAKDYFEITLPFMPIAIILAVIMTVLALVGFDAVKKATKYFMPILIIGQIILLYIFIKEGAPSSAIHETGRFSASSFFFFSSLAFVQYVSGVSASSDVTRYAKSTRHGAIGLFAGNAIGFFMTALLGALSAGLTKNLNPFVSGSALSGSMFVTIILLVCALVSMISINLSNAYTGGFSLLNAVPSLGRIRSSIVFGSFAILLSCFPGLVENAKEYISYLGALIIPISAVIIADFCFFKKLELTEDDLISIASGSFRYNFKGLWIILLSAVLYLFLPEKWSPGFLVFVFSFLFYFSIKSIGKSPTVSTTNHNLQQ
ncbi:purine-cytosine permease family protein [Falsibacillus pallidus]|uniref:Cytosine permease n=1 Tax=Falsibacillus pallidus TaxID=493781 RepID=A0A370GKT2_9BACI|nr:cytosine permease [Falsibacillus pallidus]RDI44267.1 cytosine permease [Falsibacillus pallidus]